VRRCLEERDGGLGSVLTELWRCLWLRVQRWRRLPGSKTWTRGHEGGGLQLQGIEAAHTALTNGNGLVAEEARDGESQWEGERGRRMASMAFKALGEAL
jgi:hypothetical protein